MIIDKREGMPVAPFFCRVGKVRKSVSVSFNGEHINLQWLKKCQKALNCLIDILDKDFITKYNKDIDDINDNWEPYPTYSKPERVKQAGYIYLIKQDKYYKIGRAKNIKDRMKRYIVENPKSIKIILQIEVNDYVKIETKLLQKYKKKQYRGEWFLLDNNDVKEIKNYLKTIKQE